MNFGFYSDLEVLREEYEADFSFLQNEISSHGLTPYDFLHGSCDVFAYYLNKQYKYDVECIYERDDDDNKRLIHAYCTEKLSDGSVAYIDVRGVTTDYDEFIAEFIDNGLFSNDDYSYTVDGVPSDWIIVLLPSNSTNNSS